MLEFQQRPRLRLTDTDRRLLDAIIMRLGCGVTFRAGELVRHAGADVALSRAHGKAPRSYRYVSATHH